MRTRMNLPSLGISLKILFTSYLVVVSVGLAVSGVQILLTHGMADGKFGLSVDDIVYSYYGNRGNSRLEGKLNTTMKDKASIADRAALVKWVEQGSTEDGWNGGIQQIVNSNCIKCHGTIPGLADFRTFEGVKAYTAIDEGASIQDLTRVSHIHLFGIAFIFFFVCLIFSLSVTTPVLLKSVVIATPFAALLIDILSWWLTKWYPNAAYLEIIGGTSYNLAAAFMILTSFYEMWIVPRSGKVFDREPWISE
jgi:hypothetical protein